MTHKPLLVLKTGSTFASLAKREGDFEDWILSGLGVSKDAAMVIAAQSAPRLPDPSEISGIVITGSHSMVTEPEPWLTRATEWLSRLVTKEMPVLAICFGHQLLAQAMGGTVGWQRGGRQIGSVRVERLTQAGHDPLLGPLPEVFSAPCCHAQAVLTLPPDALSLARSEADPHQAFRVGNHAWGVQFHPEFSETVLRAYIERYRDEIRERGDDPDRLIAEIEPSPTPRILEAFGSWVKALD